MYKAHLRLSQKKYTKNRPTDKLQYYTAKNFVDV